MKSIINNYDAIIIGAGMGGAASAWALTKQGLRVLILEAGPRFNPLTDYRLDKPDWEVNRFPHKLHSKGKYIFGEEQALNDEQWGHLRSWNHLSGFLNPTIKRQFYAYHHVRGVGGSTLHFTGEAHRLHPESMQMFTRFGVGADWPLSYAELEPFYCEAENLIGVAGAVKNPIRWHSQPYPLPAHPPSYASQKIRVGLEKLGCHWEPNPLSVLSQTYHQRPNCNYCGGCNRGCPLGDKGSADVTFIPAALATGRCTIKSESPVVQLVAGENDIVKSVIYAQSDGVLEQVSAPIIILAGGAVETPRLLLVSEELGNESGLVGHNFLETISFTSSGLYPEPLGSNRGLPSDSICWDFNAPDAIPNVIGGCRFSPSILEADLAGPISYATRVVAGWGAAHKKAMREQFGNVLSIGGIGESLANPQTYIDLDPVSKDEYGISLARIHSELTENDLQLLNFMAKHTRTFLSACGVKKTFEQYGSYDYFNSTHVFGTCRMGTNSENSVVDAYGRSHRWKNLFITDASVFPSSGGGESPSLTIAALAIRSAYHIKQFFLNSK